MRFGRSLAWSIVAVASLGVVVACGAKPPALSGALGDDDDSSGDAGSDASTGLVGTGGSFTAGAGIADDGSTQIGCSVATELVYVVDVDNGLHSFDPSTLTFASIGQLNCPTAASPNSMAIDRSGTAWVNYGDGTIFKVSIRDASCQATSFVPNQAGLGTRYGMTFSANSVGSTDETLYILGSVDEATGLGLGIIDTSTLNVRAVGDFTNGLMMHAGELTGTGDARLYGFFEVDPNASLAQINPSTAATPSPMTLAGVNTGDDFSFSFWGGDFWFYTATDEEPSSTVTQLKASSDNSIKQVLTNVGFTIVGAGVSTCAPTVPVR